MKTQDELRGPDLEATQGIRTISDDVIELRILLAHALVQIVSQQMTIEPQRWLDLGSGGGHLVGVARGRDIDAVGVDTSLAAILEAEERWGPHFHLSFGSIAEWLPPGPEWNADVVTLIDVLEHLSDPLETVKAIVPHLKASGMLLIVVPNAFGWKAHREGSRWTHYTADHVIHFSPESLRRCLAVAAPGLQVTVTNLADELSSRDGVSPRLITKYQFERDHLFAVLRNN